VASVVRAAIKAQSAHSPESAGTKLPPWLAVTADQSRSRSSSASQQETSMNPISFFLFIAFEVVAGATVAFRGPLVVAAALAIIGLVFLFALKMAQQWE